MPIDVSCPTCETTFRLADNQRGKRVRCRHCADTFTVPGDTADESKLTSSGDDDRLQGEPRPARAAATSAARNEDDEAPRRRADRKPAPTSSPLPLVLGILGGITLLVVVVCGGVGYLIYSSARRAVNNVAQNPAFNQPAMAQVNIGPMDNPFAEPRDLAEALDFLQNGDGLRRKVTVEWLQRQKVDAGKQRQVVQALAARLDDQDVGSRDALNKALAAWAGKDDIPVLIKALDKQSPFGKDALMEALVKLQDPRGIEEVAKRLTVDGDRHSAAKALKAAGPSAEKIVLPYLDNPVLFVKWDACDILKEIGTKESLPALQKAAAVNQTKFKAQAAIRAINARQK